MMSLFLSMGCPPKTLDIPPPPPVHVEVSTKDKTRQQVLVLNAWYHTHRRDWKEAERLFAQAIDEDPDDIWLYLHWGDAAYRMGEWNRAAEVWRNALSLLLPSDIDLKLEIMERLERENL